MIDLDNGRIVNESTQVRTLGTVADAKSGIQDNPQSVWHDDPQPLSQPGADSTIEAAPQSASGCYKQYFKSLGYFTMTITCFLVAVMTAINKYRCELPIRHF